MPEDQLILALVPPGATVPFRRVYNLLLAVRQAEVGSWIAVMPGDWNWALLYADDLAISIQLQSAMHRHVLECSMIAEDVSERPSGLANLCRTIGRLFGFGKGKPETPAQRRSRVEREAASILETLDF
jgi:hypothetical protein